VAAAQAHLINRRTLFDAGFSLQSSSSLIDQPNERVEARASLVVRFSDAFSCWHGESSLERFVKMSKTMLLANIRRLCLVSTFLCVQLALAAQPQDSADKVVEWVAEGLVEKRPQVLWQALPSSYQRDVTNLIHEHGERMDEQLWNQTFQTLNKLVRVLDEKREFILQQPLVAQRFEAAPGASQSYDGVIRILNTLVHSELSDLNQLRTLDPESFLSGTVARLMEEIESVSKLAPESAGELENWKSVEATLLRSEGDTATVRIKSAKESEDVEFVRVEGKWIPKELADEWDASLTDARQKLAGLSDDDESVQNRQQLMMFMAMGNGVLDQLLSAQTAEEFNQTIQSILGLAMSQMMGGDEGNN